MLPVSPVFHTEVTVRIGLKTQLEWEHPYHKIRCHLTSELRTVQLKYFKYFKYFNYHPNSWHTLSSIDREIYGLLNTTTITTKVRTT